MRTSFPCVMMAVILIVACDGCGSGSSSNQSLSAAQAQEVSKELSLAVSQALQTTFNLPPAAGIRRTLPASIAKLQSHGLPNCTPNGAGETCDWPVTYTGSCPLGGAISVTGNFAGTLDGSGDGSLSSQLAIVPASCALSGLIIDGDPNVVVQNQLNFSGGAPVFPVIFSESGDVSYGPKPSGKCQVNVTYTINSATSCVAAGTLCGQPVSGSC